MKFTKEERNTIYKTLLQNVYKPTRDGGYEEYYICWKLWIILGFPLDTFNTDKSSLIINTEFPEFKIAFANFNWDYNQGQRINLLNDCILLSE